MLRNRTNRSLFRHLRLLLPLLIGIAVFYLSVFRPAFSQESAQSALFQEVWQTVNENFFDPNFNGVDWQAMRDTYQPLVAQTDSQEAAAAIINQMLAELNTSHTRLYTQNEPAYYQILGIFVPRSSDFREELQPFFPNGEIEYTDIGIFTQEQNGQIFVSGVLEGSPAAAAGIEVGDQILAVDDQPFHPIQSFAGKADQEVTVQIQRSPDPNSQRSLTVTPKPFDALTMFLDAQDASIETIEQGDKTIGYIHIWSYAGEQYQDLLEEELLYGRLKEADSLVLDLRDGWGGTPVSVLNIYTGRGPDVTSILRDGTRYTSSSHWAKPVVMLVNQGSRSAKEILAYGFQHYDIGPVVGTTTAGAVVAGRPFLMSDGSVLYVAVADVYVDGETRLEGVGVTPDVVVPFTLEYAQGADPQKERAIAVAVEAIEGNSLR